MTRFTYFSRVAIGWICFVAFIPPLFGEVVINEIHYDPAVKTEPVEFVELHNTGASTVDLSGWRLEDGVDYLFPAGTTLAAGGYLVIAQNPAALQSKFGATSIGPWVGRLDNAGDKVSLKNAEGDTEDKVSYQLGFPWPTVGDAPGDSIELLNPLFDNDLGGNWRASIHESFVPGSGSQELIPIQSHWNYRKATSEASSPTTLWRNLNFDDASWLSDQAPIGFGEPGHVITDLLDMRGNYTGVFFRKIVVVENLEAITSLLLEASYDDGFKVWINGVNVLNASMPTSELAFDGTADGYREDLEYIPFILNNPENYLVSGTNIIAVQAHNGSLWSSDFWFDARLSKNLKLETRGPSPGQQNRVATTNAPPQIRQVDHSPKSPASAEEITIVAKITDPEGVGAVSLLYQIMEPGNYIELTDPDYTNLWTTLSMNDDGANGDAMAGDSIYTAIIPASVQQHRRLVRYRISAIDGTGNSLSVPYANDPQPNFAYFCYDGVPAWQAAVQPGTTASLDFGTNVMRRIPSVHLISKKSSVEDSTWFERYRGDEYKWSGTLVYDGKVYDHIRYRARGGTWRYAMCKNMWKFDFNRGHDFQMHDDYGRKYGTKWRKLNLGANIQQGNYLHRGEQGMFESVGSRLFNLAGVESFHTTFLQLRIIDDVAEAPADQYEGDFWGLYLATEQLDGRFLDQHDLPDGNFYKMESGSGELNNAGPLGPSDKSDLNEILNNYTAASDAWWNANWDLESYYSYQAIIQGIHHYDINGRKNFFYYNNPETGIWKVIPWDLDLTWADNMYFSIWGGRNALSDRILATTATNNLIELVGTERPEFRKAFRNRTREIRDLLFNAGQGGQLIDEQARLLRDPAGGSPSCLDADRAMWDYNPKMNDTNYVDRAWTDRAGTGKFYQWTEPGVSQDFNGCVQLMKNYVEARGMHMDDLATDLAIPNTPMISYTGATDYSLNGLSFNCSDFIDPQGTTTFAAMQWRAGEVLDVSAPTYDPTQAPPYEIIPQWESGELFPFNANLIMPPDALKVGHAYRVRVRMKDTTGRWSHWSSPMEFITTEASTAGAMLNHLRISEVMYDSPSGSDFDFVELHNTHPSLSLELGGAAFTKGIDFNFPGGTTLEPNGYLLVIGHTNAATFRAHYGLNTTVPVAGSYVGKLANGGETLRLKTAPGGSTISEFDYGNGRTWPLAAAGAGHSLVPIDPDAVGQATGALDYPGNWRASTFIGGSPGAVDPTLPAPTVVLNEIAAHTDYNNPLKPEYDSIDWIELHNPTAASINLAGWYLSDDPSDPAKWAMPAVSIPAGGYRLFNEVDDFHNPITTGFGLDKAGEQVLLSYLPGTAANRVADAIGFKGQENGVSLSRYPAPTGFWYPTDQSPFSANLSPHTGLRLAEVMYQPPRLGGLDNTRDEYIEIHNPTLSDVTLQNGNETWRLNGGIEYTFPDNTLLPSGETLLVVSFDPTDSVASNAFMAAYFISHPVRLFGPYTGKLSNRSDRITLEKPQLPDLSGEAYSWVIEDETVYANQTPFSSLAAGTGYALVRISNSQHGLDPTNWQVAPASPGTEHLDRDRDGMPDDWENAHSLNPDNAADALIDSDGDGLSNLDEYWSGTNPRDPDSVLKFDWIGSSNAVLALRFTAQAEKSYSIQYRAALDTDTWQTLTNVGAAASTETIQLADPASVTNAVRYYRLETPAAP